MSRKDKGGGEAGAGEGNSMSRKIKKEKEEQVNKEQGRKGYATKSTLPGDPLKEVLPSWESIWRRPKGGSVNSSRRIKNQGRKQIFPMQCRDTSEKEVKSKIRGGKTTFGKHSKTMRRKHQRGGKD